MMTTFIDRKPQIEPITASETTADDVSKPRVLIVEDDAAYRFALQLILSKDYTVQAFDTAVDALEYLRTNKNSIDLILSDRMLPLVSGTEFAQIVKSDPGLAHIPFIMHTAAFDVLKQSEQTHIDLYMQKKLSYKELLAVIEQMLAKSYPFTPPVSVTV